MRQFLGLLLLPLVLMAPTACRSSESSASPPVRPTATANESSTPSPPKPEPADCFNPEGGRCLGALAAGAYVTEFFNPTLHYTVPEGWVNAEDLPGNFQLYLAGDSQDDPDVGGSYIGIYADAHAPARCKEVWADGVGTAPRELTDWYRQHRGLAASRPRSVTVGGLPGLLIDLPLRRDWRGTCPWSDGSPVVPVLVGGGVSRLHHVVLRGVDVRLVLLEWGTKNVTIEITSVPRQHSRQEFLDLVQPVLDSLHFDV
jgi:hypothetical protein